jgi:RNA polymerase sigma-70 factor (ECF subfamily)
MRDVHDAEDVVQQAMLRACRGFEKFRGADAQGWLLAIVRNGCYTELRRSRRGQQVETLDEQTPVSDARPDPAAAMLSRLDREALSAAIEELPAPFREVFVLREMEQLSYAQIAEIADVPVGTVMSRLSRARQRLQDALTKEFKPSEEV